MPSILSKLDHIGFIAGRPFVFNGEAYQVGDEVDAAGWSNLETLVRTRHLIPVVDDPARLPFQFRRTVVTRERAYQKLGKEQPKQTRKRAKKDV